MGLERFIYMDTFNTFVFFTSKPFPLPYAESTLVTYSCDLYVSLLHIFAIVIWMYIINTVTCFACCVYNILSKVFSIYPLWIPISIAALWEKQSTPPLSDRLFLRLTLTLNKTKNIIFSFWRHSLTRYQSMTLRHFQ